ncbi:Hect ubiquitin ligase, partial [Globisporangium splendens]
MSSQQQFVGPSSAMYYQFLPLVALFGGLVAVMMHRGRKDRIQQQQLQTPLLSLCGQKLPTAPVAAASTSNEDDAESNEDSSNSENTTSASTTPTVTTKKKKKLTSQQLRVRKRKEWMRKLDVEGNMFWYRGYVNDVGSDESSSKATSPSSSSSSSSSAVSVAESQYPGYVVQFTSPASSPDTATVDNATANEKPSESESPTIITNAFVSMNLVAAAEANAAVFPTGSSTVQDATSERKKEVVEFAAKDFPTKYAHFVVSTSALIVPAEVEHIKLSVHREYMLEQSVSHVSCIDEKNMRSFMRIKFLDENGVDAGGVHREWFLLVNELLLDPVLGLFQRRNHAEQTYYFNPNSAHDIGEDHLTYYFSSGRLVGRALLEGGVWGFHLALPLIKIILGIPVSFTDLESLDPALYRSLAWILENDGAETLGLDFSVTEQRGDDKITIDLIPNGRNIPVTDANKAQFVERKFQYVIFESVSSQMYMFLKGLYDVIPQDLLMIFDAEEFDYLLCGTQELNVDDWEANTVASVNLQGTSVLKWFWEVVRDLPNEYRRRLLQFATGSSRVPLSGFAGLTSYDGRLSPFNLKGVSYYSTQYISSHACFNRLDLPLYRTKKELETVLRATLETELYGFTIA